jgi:hypothetical protein
VIRGANPALTFFEFVHTGYWYCGHFKGKRALGGICVSHPDASHGSVIFCKYVVYRLLRILSSREDTRRSSWERLSSRELPWQFRQDGEGSSTNKQACILRVSFDGVIEQNLHHLSQPSHRCSDVTLITSLFIDQGRMESSSDNSEDNNSVEPSSGDEEGSKKSGDDEQVSPGRAAASVGSAAADVVVAPGRGAVDDDDEGEEDGVGKVTAVVVERSEAALPPADDDDDDDDDDRSAASSSGALSPGASPAASKPGTTQPPAMAAAAVVSSEVKPPVRRKARVAKAGRKKKPVDMPRRPLSGYVAAGFPRHEECACVSRLSLS